jgi:hypothetical protein
MTPSPTYVPPLFAQSAAQVTAHELPNRQHAPLPGWAQGLVAPHVAPFIHALVVAHAALVVTVQPRDVRLQHAPVGGGCGLEVSQNAFSQERRSRATSVPVHAERATTEHVDPLQHAPYCAGHWSGSHVAPLPAYTPLRPPLLVVVQRSWGWIVQTGHA